MKTMQTIDQIITEAPVATPNTSLAERADYDTTPRPSGRPRVVVVGAGFGGLHVAAKRYLCWKERAYFDDLSDASRKSLHLQGGPMSETEAREFEREPYFDLAVRVRRYDDMGKVPEMRTPDLDSFRPLLETFLSPQD